MPVADRVLNDEWLQKYIDGDPSETATTAGTSPRAAIRAALPLLRLGLGFRVEDLQSRWCSWSRRLQYIPKPCSNH